MKYITRGFSALLALTLALAALPVGSAFALGDTTGPITSAVLAAPDPAPLNSSVTITATVDDSTTGNSNILSAEFSVNGGAFAPMTAVDGAFDSPTENVTASFTVTQVGTNHVCVQGTDVVPNTGTPVCVDFTANDTVGPITSNVVAAPNPATLGQSVTVTATVDDTTTGNSNIQSAEFSVNGGAFAAMTAVDGTFDTPTEDVTGSFTSTQSGGNTVCVRGTDAAGNVGDAVCSDFTSASQYAFKGFFPPVRNTGNRVKAGRVIPLKWKLTFVNGGAPVLTKSVILGVKSYAVDCTTLTGDPSTAVMERNPGRALLRSLGLGRWIFLWKTPKAYRNTCRMAFVALSDGSMSPPVLFRFK